MHESVIVIAIVVAAHVLLAHFILRRLGVGRAGAKHDCGCGSCDTKEKR
jgi:hypothetical protein